MLQFLGIVAELGEALFPEAAVIAEPLGGTGERRRVEAHRAELGGLPTGDEPCPFKHFQMFRDGLLPEREGRHELIHRGFAMGEPRQDRPPCRVGQSRENEIQLSHK